MRQAALFGTLVLLAGGSAAAQTTFSITHESPTIATPDSALGDPITEADLLTPATGLPALGPLPVPAIAVSGGAGGLELPLHAGCMGHPPGAPCGVEVDALSYGNGRHERPGPARALVVLGRRVRGGQERADPAQRVQ